MPAKWWSPVVNNLALLQGANTHVGLLVTSIDLGRRPTAVTVSWADGSAATLRIDADADCAAIRQRLAQIGPGLPRPELDNRVFWVPDDESASPYLVHAWVLQELGRSAEYQSVADMWGERLELLYVSGDSTQVEAVLHLTSSGYAVRVPIEISPPGAKYIDMAYALAKTACTADDLPVGEPHEGIPTFLGPAY
ncbi:hypothetical protein [Saccharopolyspora dendranthemae]|uniref:Uncharacterized protein n=1 Tax=Saccharopolyspora dendranthemae TaxID=1181886 RepID=A0A561V9R8_9PSEU|nr:hypothetical protein [Saccharopolyspora dendranthemae]TWG08357.1 hypothetical protein FHU35_11976 [Saccharopolyspora dendranthemae]